MLKCISFLTWNVHGKGGICDKNIQKQIDFLEDNPLNVDVFLFQAVDYTEKLVDRWGGQLERFLEYFTDKQYNILHTADWAQQLVESGIQPHTEIEGSHNRCNMMASRWPITRSLLSLRNSGNRKPEKLNYYNCNFPEKTGITY